MIVSPRYSICLNRLSFCAFGQNRMITTIIRPPKPFISNTYNENQCIGEIQVIPAPGHSIILYSNVLFIGQPIKLLPAIQATPAQQR